MASVRMLVDISGRRFVNDEPASWPGRGEVLENISEGEAAELVRNEYAEPVKGVKAPEPADPADALTPVVPASEATEPVVEPEQATPAKGAVKASARK